MGAVRNLFVRIGGDASGAVKSFNSASRAGANAGKSIKKSSAQTKQSIRETFASSVPSIKEYTAQVARTKTAHQTATQNVSRLKDEVSRLTGIYDSVKNATSGLDLSKSLAEQIASTGKELDAINAKIYKTQMEINRIGTPTSAGKAERLQSLQDELRMLAAESDSTATHLRALDSAAEQIGSSNIGYASVKGLEQLQQKIQSTKNDLRTAQMVASETGKTLRSMGVGAYVGKALKGIGAAAAQAAGTGVKKLWSGLKNLTGAVGRGIASLPGKLRDIGKSAASGTDGLTKMVKSIRNIGIASLGMKVATGLFGRLRSIISSYISQNEELNASITSMKNQMGEALLPAINIVIAAMQRIMPVVTAVSHGINSIFKTVFGDIAATSKKIESTAEELNTYGFDQITKESDTQATSDSSASDQGGEQSALVKKLTGWLTQLKDAFMSGDWKTLGATFAAGINGVFSALDGVDIGSKCGAFINAVTTTMHSLFSNVDFIAIGQILGRKLTDIFGAINWQMFGETIGKALLALPSIVIGFILDVDWATVGSALTTSVLATLETVTAFIREMDWSQVTRSISQIFDNIDWEHCKTTLKEGVSGVLDMLIGLVAGLPPFQGLDFTAVTESLQGLWQSIWNFAELIGGVLANVYETVLKPILGWVIEDAAPASVDVLTAAFDALSAILDPVMAGFGGLMAGLEPVIAFIEDVAMMALNELKELFAEVGQVFTEKGGKVQEIVSGIGDIIAAVWEMIEPIMVAIKGIVGSVFGFIVDIAGTSIGVLVDVLSGLIDFVAGVFTGDWGRAWDGIVGIFNGIVDGIKGVINGVIGLINGLIRGVCDGINVIIQQINKLSFEIPDWVPGLGGKTFGFNIQAITAPQIPMLAQGGVLEKGQVGFLEGNGDEAVVPLEKNTGWIDALADKLAAKTAGNNGSSGGSAVFQFYLGNRKITEYFVKDINQITRENGVCPIRI